MKTAQKIGIIATLLLSTAFTTFSQNYLILVKPVNGDGWGFANIKGEMVIPAAYKKAYSFSENIAVVFDEKAKKFVFLTPKGEQIKPQVEKFEVKAGGMFDFRDVGFANGLIPVLSGKKWGYLDEKGNISIPLSYQQASEFNEGYAVVTKDGHEIIIDKKGSEKASTDSRIVNINRFEEGLAPFSDASKKFGFIDPNGKVIIDPQFKSVGFFTGDVAWAKAQDGKVGYIDRTGKWIIQPTYLAGKNFDIKSGLAVVKTETGFVYINKQGKVAFTNPAETFESFSEGICEGRQAGLWGFFDATGKWIVKPELQGTRAFKNGYAAVKLNDKWGLIDKTGKWVIQPTFSGIKDVELVK